MPVYDYICNDCQNVFDIFRKMSDTSSIACSSCESENVKKKVSAPAFQLKGGGWYKDGYASVGSNSNSKHSTTKAEKPSSKTVETKTKSKDSSTKSE